MFRFRRYRVYVIFAIIAIGALYHFTTIDGLEGAGAASVERLKQFGPSFDSAAAAKSNAASKDSQTKGDTDLPIAVPSRVDTGDKDAENSATGKPALGSLKDKEADSSSSNKVAPTTSAKPSAKASAKAAGEVSTTERVAPKETGTAIKEAAETAAGNNPKGDPKAVPKPDKNGTATADGPADPVINPHGGEGRLEIIGATDKPKIHWSQLPEHFPVPTSLLIQIPTGTPKTFPKVQYDFKKETAVDQDARIKKRDAIRQVFSFSWSGYRKKAWLQDELSPMSGKYRNPFNNWGATLVDSLDTLWMMDLKEEFEEAVEAVGEIDFTTSPRNDIPLFETVIRYLGGLVGAYDISGAKYKVLLDKAVELADILMGAFDTPNRMPMTYYLWKPTFASQPHRAKTRVVLAELGTLSMEFTRLAQITKEARYYDAIARITNELMIWQPDTKVPGLWPQNIDASGCKKPDMSSTSTFQSQSLQQEKPLVAADKEAAADNPSLRDGGPARTATISEKEDKSAKSSGSEDLIEKAPTKDVNVSTASLRAAEHAQPIGATSVKEPSDYARVGVKDSSLKESKVNKRDTSSTGEVTPNTSSEPPPKTPDCEPQGLASPPHSDVEQFTMGGQADSTYEYLPKQYLLLGGLEEKYRTMYERAAKATRENLLYRPMIPDEDRNILHSGLLRSRDPDDKPEDRNNLTPEGTHLTCFVGGMFALGSRIFGIKEDMDLAGRLTDGCVWAYEQTSTGIMPEGYETIACKSMDSCPWNQTLWMEKMDPYGASREKNRIDREKKLKEQREKKAQKAKEPYVAKDGTATESNDSAASETKAAGEKTSKTGFEKESKSESKTRSKTEFEADVKTVSQSSLHDSSDERSELPMGKATSEKASGMESLKKRQLDEIDDTDSTDKLSGSAKENAVAQSKSEDSSSSSSPEVSAKEKDQHKIETNPTGNAPDPLKVANKEALGDAASSDPPTSTKDEEELAPAKPAPAPPAVSQADSIADEYEPPPIPTREEFVAERIKNERLPIGMVRIWEKKYILRPEAIESVFIMYRVTGDNYWREKGWKMFEAIEKYTVATYGATAIQDVTAKKSNPMDEMESFWMAETLKYFYLLFSEPSHVSLDDWVLNTEAHTFKRPKP